MTKNYEYIIVGTPKNNPKLGECLIRCAGGTMETAERVLKEVLNGTEWYYKKERNENTNIHIQKIGKANVWWNTPALVN